MRTPHVREPLAVRLFQVVAVPIWTGLVRLVVVPSPS